MTLILVSLAFCRSNTSQCIMHMDIDSAGRPREICWLVFLFKTSNLRSERWRRAAVMNFMADGTRLKVFCISPCQSDLERNWKIFAIDLNIEFMSIRGSPSFYLILLTRSAFGGALLQGVPSIAMGERIEGQCFPLVYQPPKITFNSFQNPNLSTH